MRKKLSDLLFTATSKISSTAEDLATKKKLIRAPHFSISSNLNTDLVDIRKKKLKTSCPSVSTQVLERLNKAANERRTSREAAVKESSSTEVTGAILSILEERHDTEEVNSDTCSFIEGNDVLDQLVSPKSILDATWFKNRSDACALQQKKKLSRIRKEKYAFKNTESSRFSKLMRTCASKIGSDATIDVFDKFGRESSIKDYNALIKVCIASARASNENAYEHVHKIFQLFVSMRERGFEIYEESYSPFVEFMVDTKMVEEFQIFIEWLKDGNRDLHSRIAYYEMLFWIKVGDEDKVHKLCDSIAVACTENCFDLSVSYLLAFCETDRKADLSQLLEVVNITKIPVKYMSSIFKSLGRLLFEDHMRKFISELKLAGDDKIDVSSFIYDYSTNFPNITVEDAISKFSRLHEQLDVLPSVKSCDKLIKLCCDLSKVPAAAEVVDIICRYKLDVPHDFFDSLLHACEQCCEYDMDQVEPQKKKLKSQGLSFKMNF